MNEITVAVMQAAFGPDGGRNIAKVADLVRAAAAHGANVVVPPELFSSSYFCKTQDEAWFAAAETAEAHPSVRALQPLAAELGLVIPVSIFERSGPHYYNAVVMLDADGSILGVYRKSHIPDGPGYQEKFYFRPGDTGFRVWETRAGRIGVGICWDQWFPEAARAMMLAGAEILVYPSAIGEEPAEPELDTRGPWRRVMQGHAAANAAPVAASNRVGLEDGQRFYGLSFIADAGGEIVAELDEVDEGVAVARFDRRRLDQLRASWGFFRDRRPDLYGRLVE